MMRLKNYEPRANDVLVKVSQTQTSPGGIIMPSAQKDMIMEVLKVGSLVDETVKPGMHVLVMGSGYDFPMEDEKGNQVLVIQTSVHSIAGIYDKDSDEDTVFMINEHGDAVGNNDSPGPSNIIDNPGIDQGTFLKDVKAEA
tara:strand:- start:2141 stop:2563 length:423 start_codon:yes stop_codon:yes gene_type:complete